MSYELLICWPKKEEPFPLKRHPKRKAATKYQHISGSLVFVDCFYAL